jgi:urea transport system ATP-binding protein
VLLRRLERRLGSPDARAARAVAITDARPLTLSSIVGATVPRRDIQPSIIKEMARTLKRIRDTRGLSIVVSEQVLSFSLDVADRVLVIENGEIVRDEARDSIDAAQISTYLSV